VLCMGGCTRASHAPHAHRYRKKAVVVQKVARGYLARRRHAELKRVAEEQRLAMVAFHDRMTTVGARINNTLVRLAAFDVRMREDMQLRKENEARLAAAKRQEEAEAAADMERQAQEAEVQRLKTEMATMEAEHRRMSVALQEMASMTDQSVEQQREQERLVKELETALRQQESDLTAKIHEHSSLAIELKQQLREREADLNSQVIERESIIRDLTVRVDQGQEAKEAVREMKARLRAQEVELEEAKTNCSRLVSRLDSQVDLMDATKSAHERILAQLNALLVQKESVTGAVRRELDATKADRDRAERQVEMDSERIQQLERALEERDAYDTS